MDFIHYFSKLIVKFLLHVFWIFPIRRNRITLLNRMSFTYGDNLKYLCKSVLENNAFDIEIIFPLKPNAEIPQIPIINVKPFSLKYFRLLLTSSVIVTNSVGISYLPIRKAQIVINTWHGGGPYKKTGLSVYNSYWMKKENILNDKVTTYMLSSCEYCTKYEVPALGISHEKCINSGMPRNDIFFKNEPQIIEKVKTSFDIKDNEKIILYAPTYRGNEWVGSKRFYKSDINYTMLLRTLEKKFGGKWRFALRLHPGLKDVLIEDKEILNFTTYPDMQELLYVADVVITDYSSLMWDFSLTHKPCFLYAPDIDDYEKTRGFYMPSAKWPYPIARNNDELNTIIQTFSQRDYEQSIINHHIESGSYEKGNACDITLKLIEEHINRSK